MVWAAVGQAIAAQVGQVAGGIFTYAADQDQIQQMQYAAGQAAAKSQLATEQQISTRLQGDIMAQRLAAQGRSQIGRSLAEFASSGVQVGTGTAGRVELDSMTLLALDVAVQNANTALDAWAFEVEAEQQSYVADWTRRQAGRAKKLARAKLWGSVFVPAAGASQAIGNMNIGGGTPSSTSSASGAASPAGAAGGAGGAAAGASGSAAPASS